MKNFDFLTSKFAPYLPEDCQANPGVYGFELALWLSQKLMQAGVVTSYPLGEDWGWLIEHVDGDAEFMIGCSSHAEENEGYQGRSLSWHVFIKQHLSIKQRLRGEEHQEVLHKLSRAISTALRSEGIEPSVR